MPILLHLMCGRTIQLDEIEAEAWTTAFEQGLAGKRAVVVTDRADGSELGVNPQAVLYWKVTSGPSP